ncbi:hypothetical protein HV314_26505 (plasmid) [Citrobacter sp. RHBSTW-00887]|uniref:hypothetical protein n=1 Tax=Citrobacter sp. RHBSTW-00887 TaxID=2742668 RepID=UPI0015EA5A5C|nr:hypothetical protein [Citrobacter sp. RHBSTW-00887]QLS57639.1 hypothetical protein HV314_26505 [Citrobacter sp. RHBSTW-00887]
MTSEKRGTSAEYGQEKLRERAAQNAGDETPSVKARFSKKTLSILVAGIFAVSTLGAFILMNGKPDKEPNLSIVEVAKSGISVNPDIAKQHGIDVDDDDLDTYEAGPQPTLTLPITNNEQEPASAPPDDDKSEPTVTKQDSAGVSPASSDNLGDQMLKMATTTPPANPDANSPVVSKSDPATQSLVDSIKAEPGFTDGSEVSQNAEQPGTVEITPAQEIAKKALSGATSEAPASAPVTAEPNQHAAAQTNPVQTPPSPTTRDIAGVENITKDTSGHQIDPAEFGYTEPTKTTATSDYKAASEGYTAQQFVVQEKNALTGADLDYSGHFKTVEYNSQGQNTVFVYSTFSSKVFLLPSKGKVNVYLSDEKGWSVSLLPGNILRVQRSENKGAWSQATDLFVLNGENSYSLILQAVGDPDKRTDSLKFTKKELSKQTDKLAKKSKA